ncbi:DNA-binding protein-related [Musa troglodytarum]|uniref:DNA-binding protein-related n=1 Tax=Musa troglodytarum TaxID=320322 RepID=A0A9E7EE91_9LILI|nr:DNA-binding protein-related [Musa troglodytarum]
MAESKPAMRKPEFTKVSQLRPGTSGHTLTVKVVSSKIVLQKGRPTGPQIRQMRLAQCLVGEENGMIIFTARNEQAKKRGKKGRKKKPSTEASLRLLTQSASEEAHYNPSGGQRENLLIQKLMWSKFLHQYLWI